MSAFGRIEVQAPYLRCPRDHISHRPFQRLTGLKCQGKSLVLQRALTDFGAEKSFQRASEQLKEHYGVDLHRSSVREVVENQAGRAAGFVDRERREAVAGYESRVNFRSGETLADRGERRLHDTHRGVGAGAGGWSESSYRVRGRGRPKRRRRTQWREVRLSVVETPGNGERRYAAALGSPERVGEQMLALALQSGLWGEHPDARRGRWRALDCAADRGSFPRQSFLLDRYHLLEHLYEGASAVAKGDGESARVWVSEQVERIDQGQVAEVVAECRGHPGAGGEHPLNRLAGYLESRREQLDYATAQEQGLPLGSGAVEGDHRHVIQARLKLPGTWWKVDAVNPMLALRTLRANGQWDAFWH